MISIFIKSGIYICFYFPLQISDSEIDVLSTTPQPPISTTSPALLPATSQPSTSTASPSPSPAPTPSPTPSMTSTISTQLPVMSAGAKHKKRKVDATDDLIHMAMTKLSESENQHDAFMAFGVVVGSKLKDMNNFQATVAEKIINDALFMGSLNKLTEDHEIVNKNIHHTE